MKSLWVPPSGKEDVILHLAVGPLPRRGEIQFFSFCSKNCSWIFFTWLFLVKCRNCPRRAQNPDVSLRPTKLPDFISSFFSGSWRNTSYYCWCRCEIDGEMLHIHLQKKAERCVVICSERKDFFTLSFWTWTPLICVLTVKSLSSLSLFFFFFHVHINIWLDFYGQCPIASLRPIYICICYYYYSEEIQLGYSACFWILILFLLLVSSGYHCTVVSLHSGWAWVSSKP